MATTATTAVAAMSARARREVREYFDRNNAFDPRHAVSYDPPSPMHRRQFDNLVGRGIVREDSERRYWLDRDAERLEEERRKEAAKLILKIVLIAVALSIAGVAISIAGVAIVTALH